MKRILLFFALCFAPVAWGTAYTWTNTTSDGKASTALNWTPTRTVPANTDALTFDATSNTNCQFDTSTAAQAQTITLATGYSSTVSTGTGVTYNINTLTIVAGSTFSAAGGGTFQANNLTNNGTFTGASTTNIVGTTFANNGTMNLSGDTLNFTGGDTSFSCSGNFNTGTSVNSVVLNTGNRFTLIAGCTLTATVTTVQVLTVQSGATFFCAGSSAAFNGINISGTFNGPSSTITANGSLGITNAGTMNLSGVTMTINGGNTIFTCTGNFNTGTSVSSVVLNTGNDFRLSGTCTLTVTLTAVQAVTVDSSNTMIGGGSGGNIRSLSNSGTFTAPTGTLTIITNWTQSGTFNHNNGTVSFNDASVAAHTISGNSTFFNLTLFASGNSPVNFAAGSTQTVVGTFTANGSNPNHLSLVSTSSPSTWTIASTGSCTVSFVAVKDSIASPGINAGTNSINNGNNTGWSFSSGICASQKVVHRVIAQ